LIAAVIIASGFSRRMGRSKLTLELGGATFLQRAIRAASEAEQIGRRLIVVRPEDARLVDESLDGYSGGKLIETVSNPFAADGQSASVRLAAELLAGDPDSEAVIYAVVDQPFFNGAVFDTLARAFREGKDEILVSTYDGRWGNPVLFARRFFGELQQLTGDVGGREVVRRHMDNVGEIAMPDAQVGQDIDTWEDYEAAQKRLAERAP
jgi:molybdenum cofactor cytidylyltransferase